MYWRFHEIFQTLWDESPYFYNQNNKIQGDFLAIVKNARKAIHPQSATVPRFTIDQSYRSIPVYTGPTDLLHL